MTDYRAAAADYLTTRRAMGYKLVYQGQMLAQFVAYLDAADAEHLTIRHAVDWATQPSSAARAWWAVRLSTVRAFARYLSALDPATEIPPTGLVPAPHRVVPYIYTEDDIAELLAAAGRLPTEHRADTYQTLIGLVAVTENFSGGPNPVAVADSSRLRSSEADDQRLSGATSVVQVGRRGFTCCGVRGWCGPSVRGWRRGRRRGPGRVRRVAGAGRWPVARGG